MELYEFFDILNKLLPKLIILGDMVWKALSFILRHFRVPRIA